MRLCILQLLLSENVLVKDVQPTLHLNTQTILCADYSLIIDDVQLNNRSHHSRHIPTHKDNMNENEGFSTRIIVFVTLLVLMQYRLFDLE